MTMNQTRAQAVIAALVVLSATAAAADRVQPTGESAVRFTDAHRQAAQFISYQKSIVLTAQQQAVMDKALSGIRAPCCSAFSIATCCCPCNLAKAVWGLSKFLIAEHHADASQVGDAVTEWLRFTNPNGYTGDACFTGGCKRPFDKNGCGGMDEQHVVQ